MKAVALAGRIFNVFIIAMIGGLAIYALVVCITILLGQSENIAMK
ncbi:MAG TPA: hypothetical protein VHO28_01790 [Ignavibacteriales bacterium]|nr:hypothetical protein [Ignavibacteriales bacterium]HEX3073803.1 hypothetical protein [Ignavibacteriales bacterium]